MKKYLILSILIALTISVNAQLVRNFGNYDSTYNAGKMRLMGITISTAYTGSIIALSNLWYTDKGPFQFYNDNSQWKQMDKIGHGVTAFHESRTQLELFRWAGITKKGWLSLAGMSGFLYQLPIEILDGTSPEYGASTGDLIANFTGAALLTSQEVFLKKTYVIPKFSFHPSPIAKSGLRPGTHGSTWNEQILKDYNGQTYWLSFSPQAIMGHSMSLEKENRWYHPIVASLHVSLGIGAEDMLYGSPADNQANGYTAFRQFYLAPDIDFTKIPTRRKGLKVLFYVLNVFHPPLPAMEFSQSGVKGHWIYF